MPIPFGVLATIFGCATHAAAIVTDGISNYKVDKAEEKYNESRKSLLLSKDKAEDALFNLGKEKRKVLYSSMRQFFKVYKKIKDIELIKSENINELSKFTIEKQDIIEIKQMMDIYSSVIGSGINGASFGVGSVIGFAASGGLACTEAIAMTSFSLIAAPITIFTGVSANINAYKNLGEANVICSQIKAEIEKMKKLELLYNSIDKKSEMFYLLLIDINSMFCECSAILAGIVKKKQGFFRKKINISDFSYEELELIRVTRSLAGTVKVIIDTPILLSNGNISYEAEFKYNELDGKIGNFSNVVDSLNKIDYKIKPIESKVPVFYNCKFKVIDTITLLMRSKNQK